jgi:hypothetical protein
MAPPRDRITLQRCPSLHAERGTDRRDDFRLSSVPGRIDLDEAAACDAQRAVEATTPATPSRTAGLMTSRWIGCRASAALARIRCAATSGSHRQNTSTQPANSLIARSRRSRRHQPSAITLGNLVASWNSTSAAASPTRSDQLWSPNPRESPSASSMTSRLSIGTSSRRARARCEYAERART